MIGDRRSFRDFRANFDAIYDSLIIGGGFVESDEYYKIEKERYWRTLEFVCQLDIPQPARILEIGGGQTAVLCKKLFGDDATVGDVSDAYSSPLRKAGVEFIKFDLIDPEPVACKFEVLFDIVFMLEVIEHIPLPGHIVIEHIKPFLKPTGVLFITTPNLFRIRNLIRMFLGIEFLDHFTFPKAGHGLGHQLEYSANHLRWQLKRAGMEIITLRHDNLGRRGHSFKARLGHSLVAPLRLRPIWREGLAVAARKVSAE